MLQERGPCGLRRSNKFGWLRVGTKIWRPRVTSEQIRCNIHWSLALSQVPAIFQAEMSWEDSTQPTHWIEVLRSQRGVRGLIGEEDKESPFGGRRPRPLRFGVDVDTYPKAPNQAVAIFESIIDEEETVEALRISDEGPPGTELADEQDTVEGWIRASRPSLDDRHGACSAIWRLGGRTTTAIMHGEQFIVAHEWWRESVYADLGKEMAQFRIVGDAVMSHAVNAATCHVLVTGRPQFFAHGALNRLMRAPACSISDAVSIASLHLRLSGRFTPLRWPGFKEYTTASNFYQRCALALLPEWWRLDIGIAEAASPEKVARLAVAIPSRLGKALRARDECLALITYRPTHSVHDLLGEEVENFSIALMGAFDALAAVCHQLLGIGFGVTASWSSDEFKKTVRRMSDGRVLEWVVGQNRSRAAFDLIRRLRNTVHGEPTKAL